MTPSIISLVEQLERITADLPETISLDDVRNHDDLRRLIVVADDLTNRIERQALFWAKTKTRAD